jgi:hypothetical protein
MILDNQFEVYHALYPEMKLYLNYLRSKVTKGKIRQDEVQGIYIHELWNVKENSRWIACDKQSPAYLNFTASETQKVENHILGLNNRDLNQVKHRGTKRDKAQQ